MARIVLGIGLSHSPMVVTDGAAWSRFGEVDRDSKLLVNTAGKPVTFEELERENGRRYAAESAAEHMKAQSLDVRRAVARLREDMAEARPDVVVVIGDDQMELLDLGNMPALAVFYGERLVSCVRGNFGTYDRRARDRAEMFRAYGMDRHNVWPGCGRVGLQLVRSLMAQGFDVGAMKEVRDPDRAGIGHAYGIVETQLMGDEKIPMVPVFVNTYWPPNQFPVSRCYDLGRAVRRAVEDFAEDLRVAIVASGGLSHFVTDERLDEQVLAALRAGSERDLRELPAHLLNSGSSEIRNWITVAAACEDRRIAWDEYVPVYRTPAGTGCGLAFARWS